MKFIHAADIHLDSPLVGLQRHEGAPEEALRGATRQALSKLVDLALEEEIAFVVLAGDLFDGDWRDYSTGLFFLKEMMRLRDAGIVVVWAAGNHDAVSHITRNLRWPDHMRQLSHRKAESVELPEAGVVIHGQSFASKSVTDDLAAAYPPRRRDLFNIGLLHTSLTGREGHDDYAPCSLSTLTEKGYDYWALGHVHAREVVSRDPWIVFPGNTQGRHIRETGEKGCTLVAVKEGSIADVAHRPLDVLRWARLELKGTDLDTPRHMLDACERDLNALCQQNGELPLAVRVEMSGPCAAHRLLRAQPERWAAEIRAAALGMGDGRVWIEKVCCHTRAEARQAALSEEEGPVAALAASLDRLDPESEMMTLLRDEMRDLFGKIPDLRERMDLDSVEAVADLAEDVKQLLLASLLEEEA